MSYLVEMLWEYPVIGKALLDHGTTRPALSAALDEIDRLTTERDAALAMLAAKEG